MIEHSKNCQEMMQILSDYVDGALPPDLCTELEHHLGGCTNCRVVVNTMRKTIDLYRVTNRAVDVPDGVRERLHLRLHLKG